MLIVYHVDLFGGLPYLCWAKSAPVLLLGLFAHLPFSIPPQVKPYRTETPQGRAQNDRQAMCFVCVVCAVLCVCLCVCMCVRVSCV